MRKFGGIKTWIILPIGMFLLGCASIQDVRILDREIDKLYSELGALRNENKSLEKKLYPELSALREENHSLENKISILSDENQKLKTEFLFRHENLQSEIRVLSTGIEEYKDYLKRPSKEIGQVKEDVEVRLKILEEGRKNLEERNKAQEEKIREMEERLKGLEGEIKQVESEKSSATQEVLSEPKGVSAAMGDLYKDAHETFQKGDIEGARRKFEVFLKQYPNTELSGNAQFWIGETYYQKKDFEKAILEYEKAITKYPESGKIPAALFKQALAFLELGDKTNARNLLERVVERFPHSDQAEMAKKKLETIK
ncbi:MAG: tol-pal system protein YbgF [Thermodesulfobacteriota bacterium]